ncbi:hypothetical protein D9M68_937520 [compost metagenome]
MQGLQAAAFNWYQVTKTVANVPHDPPDVIQPITVLKQQEPGVVGCLIAGVCPS